MRSVVGYPGDIVYDASKPDGTPLREGVEATYRWFVETEGRRG